MGHHQVARRRRQHRGVSIFTTKGGSTLARWKNPRTGKVEQQNLDKLHLGSAEARTDWAVRKAEQIAHEAAELAVNHGWRDMPLADAVRDYLATVATASTRVSRKRTLDAFVVEMAKRRIVSTQQLDSAALSAWKKHVRKPGHFAIPTANLRLRETGTFLRAADDDKLLRRSEMADMLRQLRQVSPPREEIRIYRPAEIRSILAAGLTHDRVQPDAPRLAGVVLAMLGTGMRLQEVLNLEWGEINIEDAEIKLPAARTKSRHGRTITLRECPTVLQLLATMRLRRGERVRVFDAQFGTWQNCVRKLIKYGAPAGFSPNDIRHTVASIGVCAPAIFGSASIYMSCSRLGHSVQVAQKHYLNRVVDISRDATAFEVAMGEGVLDLCNEVVRSYGGAMAADAGATAAAG